MARNISKGIHYRFDTKGVEEKIEKMSMFAGKGTRDVVDRALAEGVKVAKANATVETGQMRDNITADKAVSSFTQTTGRMHVSTKHRKYGYDYSKFQENGWRHHISHEWIEGVFFMLKGKMRAKKVLDKEGKSWLRRLVRL